MSNIFKKILYPISALQTIRGVQLPIGIEFLQLIVTGPPGAGKTYYINQIRGWPNEGYIDLTHNKWWKNQSLIYRPREVHLGLPFVGYPEALTVFDKEWLESTTPLALNLNRVNIPPASDSFFKTNWKHRYIFEFIIPDPKTVFKRRKARHSEGYFPVDDNLSLEMVTKQAEVYREIALYLHRAKMQVYIREDINSPPMRIVEKKEAITPTWLLPKSERTGKTVTPGGWKNLFIKRKNTHWITVTNQTQEIIKPSRIAHDGKTFELRLGKLQLHFHPEIPLGVKKKHSKKNWLIYSPLSCSVKNIIGFARLKIGESVVIGRDNTEFNDLFDFDKSIASRHLRVTNRNGDLILTPLTFEKSVSIVRIENQDNRERVEAHRYEAFIKIREIYGGPITLLSPNQAMATLQEANAIIANDVYTLKNNEGNAGGLIKIPDHITPIIVGDLHAQVDNLLKILTENCLLDCLHANTACLILLGDAIHSEISNEMDDMASSILMMDLIFKLKTVFPHNVFYLRGNHDSFDAELSKNGISQGILMQKELTELRGARYAEEMQTFYNILPYVITNKHFLACHAAPPRKEVTIDKLSNIHESPDLIEEITTNRIQRPHYLNGYKKGDVKRFRKSLKLVKKTPFIVGHTPIDPFGSLWKDAGNIKGHHIIYSGHQEKPQALLLDGPKLISLEFPAEPLLKLIEKIS
jgi:predicted phosphodiesterase